VYKIDHRERFLHNLVNRAPSRGDPERVADRGPFQGRVDSWRAAFHHVVF
jgi:hypothetical protein